MRAIAMATALALLPVPALPHDLWSNGQPIPDWIKSSCCGAADAHHLTPEQVTRRDEDYYLVAGYSRPVPVKRALPIQDGEYWIFYREDPNGQSGVYCFFVPNGVLTSLSGRSGQEKSPQCRFG
jgi:hypothetical protein